MDDLRLKILGDDLQSLQIILSTYEQKLLANERSNTLKEVVAYYRHETQMVRAVLMSMFKHDCGSKCVPAPVPAPTPAPVVVPAPIAEGEPPVVVTEKAPVLDSEDVSGDTDGFDELA